MPERASSSRRPDSREPRILGDDADLHHVEQRQQRAADEPARHDAITGKRQDSHPGGSIGRRVLLIECVVAHQIAFGHARLRPVDLVESRNGEALAAGQLDRSRAAGGLDRRQLLDDAGERTRHSGRGPRGDAVARERAGRQRGGLALDGDLAPVPATTPGAVRCVQALRHDRVAPGRSGLPRESASIAGHEFAEPHGAGADVGEDVLEVRAACGERQWPEIFVSVAKDIEGDEGRPTRVDGDDGAVENDGGLEAPGEVRQRADDVGVPGGLVPAPRRPDLHSVAANGRLDGHECPLPVVAWLVNPALVGDRRLASNREHRRDRLPGILPAYAPHAQRMVQIGHQRP